MIYSIVAYGDPVLKKKAAEIVLPDEKLTNLIADMFETMYEANGIGLAAPQIGKSIRLFVVDGTVIDDLKDTGFKKAFINPEILEESGEPWGYEEGCLSIPGYRDMVMRKPNVKIRYTTEEGKIVEETYDGMRARIIQHEYDHIEGKLFTDYASALKKQLMQGKLKSISAGKVDVDYKMKFPLR